VLRHQAGRRLAVGRDQRDLGRLTSGLLVARQALPFPYGAAFQAFGVVYGVPVWGFAVLWAALATAVTVRTARAHLPFSLTWWSFTFPVGTLVTGTTALALHTGSGVFRWAAAGLYLVLVAAWAEVSVRTVAGTWRGSLLRGAAPAIPPMGPWFPLVSPWFPLMGPWFPLMGPWFPPTSPWFPPMG
jgi:hypothetical protein